MYLFDGSIGIFAHVCYIPSIQFTCLLSSKIKVFPRVLSTHFTSIQGIQEDEFILIKVVNLYYQTFVVDKKLKIHSNVP